MRRNLVDRDRAKLAAKRGDGAGRVELLMAGGVPLTLEGARAVQTLEGCEDHRPAIRRGMLLRLRIQEGLPIRDIAKRRNEDPATLHHEFAAARDEFRTALKRVIPFHLPAALYQARNSLIAPF